MLQSELQSRAVGKKYRNVFLNTESFFLQNTYLITNSLLPLLRLSSWNKLCSVPQ